MSRRPRRLPPLPDRDGLGAARVRMPRVGPWSTVVEFLIERTGDAEGVEQRLRDGEIRLGDGTVVTGSIAYRPGGVVYLYRDLPDEVSVPFGIEVLHHDEHLLVVDKPPFLATMPRGSHVAQTALVRLRRDLKLPELAPAHRLDRLTAGVLVLTARREVRRPYQELFARGEVTKMYVALAPAREDLALAVDVRDRLVKPRGSLQTVREPGEPNAHTHVELVERCGEPIGRQGKQGLYRLTPTTGRTHQLRVHLAGLGIPIEGDPLYPVVRDVALDDFTTPLQLLAQHLAFVDPFTDEQRTFTSRRRLPLTGTAAPDAPTAR
ncbi:MAG: pseudouridine synthase [Actinobacteria bacterium]|nr:pseudouridine synthase [Actinomycetota bacterium]